MLSRAKKTTGVQLRSSTKPSDKVLGFASRIRDENSNETRRWRLSWHW